MRDWELAVVAAVEMVGSGQIWLSYRQRLQVLLMAGMWEQREIEDSRVIATFYFVNGTYFYWKLSYFIVYVFAFCLLHLKERTLLILSDTE